MADHDELELELSRFWNDVSSGGGGDAGDLDAATANAIRRLHQLAATPSPGTARERVWRSLVSKEASLRVGKEVPIVDVADQVNPRGQAGLNASICKLTRLRANPRRTRGSPDSRSPVAPACSCDGGNRAHRGLVPREAAPRLE